MMEEMNKWLSAHKKLCVITGIFVFKGQCLGWCGLRAY